MTLILIALKFLYEDWLLDFEITADTFPTSRQFIYNLEETSTKCLNRDSTTNTR
jgi:hypothetical protein